MVVFDDLGAAAAVEQYAPPAAQRVFVGKRGGRPSIRQVQIPAAGAPYLLRRREEIQLIFIYLTLSRPK